MPRYVHLSTAGAPLRVPKLSTLSGSLLLHALALAALAATTLLSPGAIREPDWKLVFVALLPQPPPPQAPPARGGGARKPEPRKLARKIPRETIQPESVPDRAPEQEPAAAETSAGDFEDEEPGGVPDGIPGGVPGGVPGGIPGGAPGGVPGGVLGSSGPATGAPGTGDSIVEIKGEVRPPKLLRKVEPDYPVVARQARAEGKVVLEVVVGRDGNVETVTVLRGNPLFDEAAVEAVENWKYAPALQSGRPVRVYLTVIVDFKLR